MLEQIQRDLFAVGASLADPSSRIAERVPVAIELMALSHLTVFVNGGQRGLQIKVAPGDL